MPHNSPLFRFGLALALVLLLSGCTKGGQLDPVELFSGDMFDSKTKLKGDREPLFPNGVPGTTSGVPADLVKGYQAPPDQADATATQPAPAAPVAAAPKPALKPKPKPKIASAPPASPAQSQSQDPVWNQNPVQPAPKRINIGAKGGAAASQQVTPPQPAWPSTEGAPAQRPLQPSQSVWPTSPPAGQAQQTAQPSQSVWPNPPATTSQ